MVPVKDQLGARRYQIKGISEDGEIVYFYISNEVSNKYGINIAGRQMWINRRDLINAIYNFGELEKATYEPKHAKIPSGQ